ncbi:50S ribosomal protein L4 [candidate division MSBL1 archaeon SCGC-AAA261F19]|uniref:Large ribosomal subunit protein uL4 n=2 Tax=candidate division MSBL1 TaxID=215777 RepID=A0A133VBF9_9EURY|nr:50S ribosomal protein L4 [candidate division MSBL1 archaeon SCGC-AAA261D19]KXB03786.1 50S ribosomal protein L4 [candidate division MSBL1 archaeon SCGC-AAA261F19]
MKVKVYSIEGEPGTQVELPQIFEEKFRPDVIRRAVLAAQSARVQPWGADPRAGKRTTAETPQKGTGLTRVKRIKGRRHHAAGRSAFAPFTSGGRRAHPPKPNQKRKEKINRKERRLAIRSAISATKEGGLVRSRGHEVDDIKEFPVVIEEEVERIKKTTEAKELFKKLGVWRDVERVKEGKKISSGKGKMRGRKYRKAIGPLLVIAEDRGVVRAARNLPGVDIVPVEKLNAELLAPGGDPARLTLWAKSAVDSLAGGMFS